MAEMEIGVFELACLRRRVDRIDALTSRLAALEAERNAAEATIDWNLTTSDAPIRLHRLYSKLDVL